MNSDVSYEVIKINEKKILVRRFSGSVKLDDIIFSFKFIIEQNLLEGVSGVITDFINSNIEFSFADLREIANRIKSNPKLKGLKYAVVVDPPQKVVFPLMVGNQNPDLGVKPFSSEESAINWILE